MLLILHAQIRQNVYNFDLPQKVRDDRHCGENELISEYEVKGEAYFTYTLTLYGVLRA